MAVTSFIRRLPDPITVAMRTQTRVQLSCHRTGLRQYSSLRGIPTPVAPIRAPPWRSRVGPLPVLGARADGILRA
jgi:hypothetical protein